MTSTKFRVHGVDGSLRAAVHVQAAGNAESEEQLLRRAGDAEKATCALMEQHAREAAALGGSTHHSVSPCNFYATHKAVALRL